MKPRRESTLVGALIAAATAAHVWLEAGLWPFYVGAGVVFGAVLVVLVVRRVRRLGARRKAR